MDNKIFYLLTINSMIWGNNIGCKGIGFLQEKIRRLLFRFGGKNPKITLRTDENSFNASDNTKILKLCSRQKN